jgi:hypothetical protein
MHGCLLSFNDIRREEYEGPKQQFNVLIRACLQRVLLAFGGKSEGFPRLELAFSGKRYLARRWHNGMQLSRVGRMSKEHAIDKMSISELFSSARKFTDGQRG